MSQEARYHRHLRAGTDIIDLDAAHGVADCEGECIVGQPRQGAGRLVSGCLQVPLPIEVPQNNAELTVVGVTGRKDREQPVTDRLTNNEHI